MRVSSSFFMLAALLLEGWSASAKFVAVDVGTNPIEKATVDVTISNSQDPQQDQRLAADSDWGHGGGWGGPGGGGNWIGPVEGGDNPGENYVNDPILNTDPNGCGTLQCQNGGDCAANHNYDFDKALCDCSRAFQTVGDTPPYQLVQYVGRECEIEVVTNDYCAGNKDLFCVNGGVCRVQALNFTLQPCRCKDGFTGRHCEYRVEHVQPSCSLTCRGVGTCQHGMNPHDTVGANGPLDITTGGTINFMHCICNKGYAGANCEYEYTKCGGRGHYCYHGSTCVPDPNGGGGEVCECTYGEDVKVAGEFCEHRATDNCEDPKPIGETAALTQFGADKVITQAQFPFCVNNGVCYEVDEVNTDAFFCDCDNTGYVGKRCEHKDQPAPAPGDTPSPSAEDTTWEPTQVGSQTEWVTTWEPTTLEPIPTDSPTKKPTLTPTYVVKSSSKDNDRLSPGGKFGIVLLVIISVLVLAIVIVYFRRRAQFVQSFVHQEGNLHNEGDDQDVVQWDAAKTANAQPEEQALEMTKTVSASGSDDNQERNGAAGSVPPPAAPTALDVDEKDLSHVEIV